MSGLSPPLLTRIPANMSSTSIPARSSTRTPPNMSSTSFHTTRTLANMSSTSIPPVPPINMSLTSIPTRTLANASGTLTPFPTRDASHFTATARGLDSSTIVGRPSIDNHERKDINSEFHRQAYGPDPGDKGLDAFEVHLEPDSPENPHSWSRLRKWYLTGISGLLVMNATFASSAPSEIIPELEKYFSFSAEVGTLLIALFVAGYCVGPLLWGPLSEQYGRRPIFILTFVAYTGFQVGCALSRNTASILVFRFLGGVFASAPLTNSGAVISDIWDPSTRGKALGIFTLAPFAGPALAPLVSGFMAASGVSWRWTFWVLTLFAGTCLVAILFTVPETYLPVLLVHKAARLRKETGDERYWAPLDKQHIGFIRRAQQVVGRPFKMLVLEPMLLAITIYMSFIYGCIYLLFEAYPIVFTIGHHFNPGISGLMFLPIFLGGTLGIIVYFLVWNPRYERAVKAYAPLPVPPEHRLDLCLWATPIFAISFFWFGWTSYPSISFWAPMLAGLPIGFSVIWVFLALFNYIIDAYLFLAASALAANTIVRSCFGAGFPLFATQMFEKLNPRWASTLLGCIAVLLGPIPFVLKKYGPALRKRSKFAPPRPDTVEKTIVEPKKEGDIEEVVAV